MTLFVLAYAAGLLTVASPCIFPILPFVLARAETPFGRGGLPMLIGLALTFAAVAGLAAVAGGWAMQVNQAGRVIALVVMTLFGLTLLFPMLASRAMAPVVAIGLSLSDLADRQARTRATFGASLLLGVATGLVWAPCAGPALGLILTGGLYVRIDPGRPAMLTLPALLLPEACGASMRLGMGWDHGSQRGQNEIKRCFMAAPGANGLVLCNCVYGSRLGRSVLQISCGIMFVEWFDRHRPSKRRCLRSAGHRRGCSAMTTEN